MQRTGSPARCTSRSPPPSPTARTPLVAFFLAEDTRDFWVDASYFAGAFAASLPMESAAHASDPRLTSLVTELTKHSALFRGHRANFEAHLFRNGIKRFVHPVAACLDLPLETTSIACLPAGRTRS